MANGTQDIPSPQGSFERGVYYPILGGVFHGYNTDGTVNIQRYSPTGGPGEMDTVNYNFPAQRSGFHVGMANDIYTSAQPFDPNITPVREGDPASLWQQMLAARQDRPGGRPTAERYQFSHGGSWDATNTFGPTWGKGSNYDNYPLPGQNPPVPVQPVGNAPAPGTNAPGLLGGGSAPVNSAAPLNRNGGAFPAPRGDQASIGQQPSMRQNPGLLGGQMIGSQAGAEVATGRASKSLPVTNSVTGGSSAGMSPMGAAAGQGDFRFGNTSNPQAANYNALAGVSPQLAQQYLSTVGGGSLRPQLYNEAAPGVGQGLLNTASPTGGGFTGGALAQQLAQAIPGFAGSKMAQALAQQGAGGFTGFLTPAQAQALGLQANTFGGALPNSNFYTVPLAK